MLSLLRQRLSAPNTLSKVVAANSCLLSTRRSFLTSVPRYEPAEAAPKKTAAAKKAAADKPASKTATKTKGKDVAKKSVATKAAKEPKVEKPTRLKLTVEDMPPKHPGTAYIIFFTKYLKGLSDAHKPKSLSDIAALAKDAGSMWRSLTEAEKQPFVDDYQRARAIYTIEHKAWLAQVPSGVLEEINRRKAARGKNRIRTPKPEEELKRPLTSFFRYIADFRKSAEAEEILKTIQRPHVQISKTAGEKWRAMDDDAKAPYIAATKKETDVYKQAMEASTVTYEP